MVTIIGVLIAFSVVGRNTPQEPQIGFYDVYLLQPTYPMSWVLQAKGDACWNELVFRESGWRTDAVNRSSGACGLAQALPCSKIVGDWQDPEVSLEWMHSYIHDRYGSTCNALNFQIRMNWY